MFYVVGKIMGFLLAPTTALILVLLIGAALQRSARERLRRFGLSLLVAGTLLLSGLAFTPLSAWSLRVLEQRFPPLAANAKIDGIILLGGGLLHCPANACPEELNDSGHRLIAAAALARRYPNATVVISGGPQDADGGSEAKTSAALLETMGIAPARILIEGRSLSTAENARFTSALIGDARTRNWALVTSAFHMPRAIGSFRRAGIRVVAAPCNYRALKRPGLLAVRASDALSMSDLAAKEYLGLAGYYASGRTSALLAGP